jgi:N-acyl-D-amino-acid deacylase
MLKGLVLVAVLAFGAVTMAAGQAPAQYDLVIRGGRVLDGCGNPWVAADVAMTGDSIAAIGPRLPGRGRREIDAAGQIVSPGFIDIHTHARRGIFQVPTAENYVRQGVTTIFEGPDGGSPVPLKPFFDRLAATTTSPNFGMFIGQGSVREAVIGRVNRRASPEEIEKMKDLVREGMLQGAFGLSSGLVYVPGIFTPPEEVEALAEVAGRMGGIYISHMRNEAAGVIDSVRETIAVGEKGRMPTQVTHHKVIGTTNWGKSTDTLQMIALARSRGVDATIDAYPYTASKTSISVLMPPWSLEGEDAKVVARLKDPAERARIRDAVVDALKNERGGGDPKNVVISNCPWDTSLEGKNLADITRGRGVPPTLENAADAAMWILERGNAGAIFHAISEEDVVRILQDPNTMVASDGEVVQFGQAAPHPRSYGTFVRVLARYVREKHVLTLQEAVRKMTSMPAARVGLGDRGILRPGMKADVAIWDAERILDRATFEKPHQYAQGVTGVIVNGVVVFDGAAMTPARPGRILYGPAYAGK